MSGSASRARAGVRMRVGGRWVLVSKDGVTLPPPPQFDDTRLYAKQLKCPLCDSIFTVLRVRQSRLIPAGGDTDLYQRYKGINPLCYAVDVCPTCLYAAYPDHWEPENPQEREALEACVKSLQDRHQGLDFNQQRDETLGDCSLELALACYSARPGKPARTLARLHHARAWLARDRGDAQGERAALAAALAQYRWLYESDRSVEGEAVFRLIYLLAEVSWRLGLLADTARYLERAMGDPAIKRYPRWERQVRDRWDDLRKAT